MQLDFYFFLELIGFILNLFYLHFVIRERIVAWIWSILASAIFVWICFASQLYIQAGLYVFYMVIAFYGIKQWKGPVERPIQSMSIKRHISVISIALVLGGVFGYISHKFSDQKLPYLDGFITSFALITTLLIISKHRENWLYWIVINASSIYLYGTQQLYWLASMSFFLLLISFHGYYTWREKSKKQKSKIIVSNLE